MDLFLDGLCVFIDSFLVLKFWSIDRLDLEVMICDIFGLFFTFEKSTSS